ncbi:hypothetical protein ACFL6N_04075 [Thermodesulfobacteriota bacterium]
MTKNYLIELSNGITEISFIKKAELIDLCNAMDDVADNYFSELRLWDMSCGVNLSTSDIKKVAEYGKLKFLTPGRSAIVAPTDLTYGTARMGDVYREDNVIVQKVFRTKQKALDWLYSQRSELSVDDAI